MMKKVETGLQDCYIVKPSVFGDDRGYFSPFFIQKDLDENGLKFEGVVQCNRSKSSKGVVRGLHFQKNPMCQTKLVEVIQGSAIDVVVDIREGSPTYGRHVAVLLKPYDSKDEESGRQLYVPRGFAHGFAVLSETAIFQYKCDNFYAPQADGGISILDESLGIDWQIPTDKALLSEKDMKHALLKDFDSPFSIDMNLYPDVE